MCVERETLIEKVIFKQTPKEICEVSHGGVWGRNTLCGDQQVQRPVWAFQVALFYLKKSKNDVLGTVSEGERRR